MEGEGGIVVGVSGSVPHLNTPTMGHCKVSVRFTRV